MKSIETGLTTIKIDRKEIHAFQKIAALMDYRIYMHEGESNQITISIECIDPGQMFYFARMFSLEVEMQERKADTERFLSKLEQQAKK